VWQVWTPDGVVRDARLRGRLKQDGVALKLAVGDHVELAVDTGGATSAIATILPRRSRLARREPGGGPRERVVIANIDQVIAVFAAANPEPHPRMLDRFLLIAEANDLPARIVINKVELDDHARAAALFADFARAGYPLHFTSATRGTGLEELHAVLAGRISALTGPSGVGKSSLLNAMYPGLHLRVGEISASVNKGRHTTVGALLHPLPDRAFVADTPGLREVGVWGIDPARVAGYFPELRPYVDHCRFNDCTHTAEPDCALRAAVARGEVSAARFDSFLKLRAELEDSIRKG
jgi:ribosome biogenesis GTPase